MSVHDNFSTRVPLVVIVCTVVALFGYPAPTSLGPRGQNRFQPAPTGGITFHVSVIPDELHKLKTIGRRVVLPLRQCFGEFHVVVDLPHGGKTYGDGKLKGPRYLPVRNLTMTLDDIERTVRDNIGDAVRLLDTHCSARVHVAVEMLNHSTLGPWLERHFDFSGPAVNSSDIPFNDTRPDLPIIQRFFMNTVMYAHAIIATETRYILHTDVDTIGLWNSPPTWASYYEPTFVRRAIDAFEDNTTVVFARPAEQCYSTSVKPVHLDSGMSCRLFISAPSRFQRMVPFQYWAAHVEDMIVTNMAMHNMSAVIIGQSRPCWTDTWFQRKVLRDHNWS